jgi:protein pelota
MKILKIDTKLNEIIVITNSLDDLWHLEKVVDRGDIVFGKTDRKIKPSKEGEKTIRQTIFVELEVENVSFQEFSENLKISGIIIGGKPSEFIELKAHQSIDIKIGEKIKFRKKQLKNWQIERLKKAEKESATSNLLVVLMDDENAELAFVNQFSINKKAKINAKKQGKRFEETKSKYFEEVTNKIIGLKPNKVLIAGPGFTKENFKKFLENQNSKLPKIFVEGLNSVGETGFRELISQGKLEKVEKELQLSQESKLIEELVESLPKNKAEYGIKEVEESITNGLVEKLIVSETFLLQNREDAEKIMDLAEKMNCKVHIISSKNPQEKTVHNLGGVTAILHYRKK